MTDKTPLLITNNRSCVSALAGRYDCLFDEGWNYGRVLREARDKVHQGYVLISHPLCGSLKPNQTPYKSLLLSKRSTDVQETYTSVVLIEQAIADYEKFRDMHPAPAWSCQVLQDFRTVDLSFMQSVTDKLQLI